MASFTHAHPFDPTYGYSPQALLAIQPPPVEPPDFDAFWEASFLAARRHPIRLKREALVSAREAFRVERWDWEVPAASAFSSGAPEETYRVGAWLTLPADGEVHALLVVGHGYGGREAPDFAYPRAAALHVCMPGFNLSAGPGIPAQSDAHVVHGIESRESYLLRPCAASLWSAATALLETWPRLADRLYYEGGSFGGGMGALMLPWDARYRRAVLVVPTFGNHPVRLECPCVGSGESVRRWHRGHPEVTEVLPYYDAATAAKRIRIPVLCAPALFDPAVPPPGQFSVANALAGPKRLFVFSAGHHDHPSLLPEQAAFARMTREWLDPEREPWTEPPGPHAIILGRADGATESR